MSFDGLIKSWMVDPPWQKVFKHTFDVLQDYLAKCLVALGAVTLSVRMLTSFTTGDLTCFIIGITDAVETGKLLPYVDSAFGLMNYAQTDHRCIGAVYNPFMEYQPFIMLMQALVIVVLEKFTFRIPRIAQKVERFYKNIVEESLFGRDPDVTEDINDPRREIEAISRNRQRNEICVSLKRSSIIQRVYIWKNVLKALLVIAFVALDIYYCLEFTERDTPCYIPIIEFPIIVPGSRDVFFQCRAKKMGFFLVALYIHATLLAFYGLLSLGALWWWRQFRAVTNLLRTVEEMPGNGDDSMIQDRDKDFLFLFDLLAHTSGIESTLRVLTHSDTIFYEICKPDVKLFDAVILEEDGLRVKWKPAPIERWIRTGKRSSHTQRIIDINSYEVTIYPAENVFNVFNKRIHQQNGQSDFSQEFYEHSFSDLNGGRTEYVVTIACVIGQSKMKCAKIVTNLMPYGPILPRTGMTKTANTESVELFWDPPKGDFAKYILDVFPMMDPTFPFPHGDSSDVTPQKACDGEWCCDENVPRPSHLSWQVVINSRLNSYTLMGLDPGEKYTVDIKTKTGKIFSRQSALDTILTKPLMSDVDVTNITSTSCLVKWSLALAAGEQLQTCVKEFCIKYKALESQEVVIKKVPRNQMSKQTLELNELIPNTKYEVSVSAFSTTAISTSACSTSKVSTLESDALTKSFSTASDSGTSGTGSRDIGNKM